jgi:hypothetical protein
MIGNVEARKARKSVRFSPSKHCECCPTKPVEEGNMDRRPMKVPIPVPIHNKYQLLQEDKGEEEEAWIHAVTRAEERAGEQLCALQFHVTDSKRILASVAKINEAGNDVVLGAVGRPSYVRNVKSGARIPLHKENNVFVLNAIVKNGPNGKKRCKIVVDSGAAENVMPKDILPGISASEPKRGLKFVAANGKDLGNYGRKVVEFVPADEGGEPVFGGLA